MHRRFRTGTAVVALGILLPSVTAFGQAPAAAPAAAPASSPTLWNFLGVPKNPLDGVLNRQGNFPGMERKPKLKKIADPANLASKNPAIKKAAELKAEADLKDQKIKAIKYLADLGCSADECHEGVAEALAAALEDCTEEVRYEAAKAILRTAQCDPDRCDRKRERQTKSLHEACKDSRIGMIKKASARMKMLHGKPGPDGQTLKSKLHSRLSGCDHPQCQQCACSGCCTAEIRNKLSEIVYARDDRGCFKEPSERVRAVAREALRACPAAGPWTPEPVTPEAVEPEDVPLGKVQEPIAEKPRETTPDAPKKETTPDAPKLEALPDAGNSASGPLDGDATWIEALEPMEPLDNPLRAASAR